MVVRRDHARSYPYLDKMERELDAWAALVSKKRKVRQVHFGGGTPTFLPPDALDRLIRDLKSRFDFAADAELGVEVHPNETRREHLEVMAKHGWNRLSMGVQDFDEEVQRTINRIQPEELTRRTVEDARELGYKSINVDLIYGLPHQTVKRFALTVDKVLSMSPDRFAVFNFAYLPDMLKHQRLLPEAALPAPQEKLAILAMTIEKLTKAGYVFIGFDHFAKPDDELAVAQRNGTLHRNFQGYTTHKGLDLLAFGVSAISNVGRAYAQNKKDLAEYESTAASGRLVTERGFLMSDDDLLRREVIMTLASSFVVKKGPIEQRFKIRFDEVFADALAELAPMQADGLVELHPDRVEVTARGRMVVRNLCMPFDAYLKSGPKLFSRTV
jgi:oxygen-independent coproporphyrinogen-3 oxidase